MNAGLPPPPADDARGTARAAVARDAAEANARRDRELFENANDILYTIDLDGVLTAVNRAAERLTGYAREELLGRSIADLIVAPAPDAARAPLARKLAGEPVTIYELVLRRKDGSELPLEVSSRLLLDAAGRPVGVQGAARDITERKRLEAERTALLDRERAARQAAEAA